MTRAWLVAALAATLGAAQPAAAASKRLRLAVLALKPEGVESTVAETVDETLTADLGRGGKYEVIGRSEIEAMAGFQSDRIKLGCAGDTACLAEIGGALGVDRLAFGSLGKVGDLYVLNTRLLEIGKARVIARDTETVKSADALIAAAERSAQILLGEMPAPLESTAEVHATSAGGLRHTAWPWVTLGAVAVAGGIGAYLGYANVQTHQQFLAAPSQALANQGNQQQLAEGILYGAAGVALLVSVGMLIFGGGG